MKRPLPQHICFGLTCSPLGILFPSVTTSYMLEPLTTNANNVGMRILLTLVGPLFQWSI